MANVLIVDDDSQFRRALRIALAAQGHHVSEAANGREALMELDAKATDVVLLDWQMPVMNGEEACGAMRARSGVPIIVISVSEHEQEALAAGADAFLKKPVDAGTLRARIESCVGPGN